MSFRPTPFTRAFRSLDAFTADIAADTNTPTAVVAVPAAAAAEEEDMKTTTKPDELIVIESMEFEQRPIRMPPKDFYGHYRRRGEGMNQEMNRTYVLEYELKVLQMKLNWLMFIMFLLVCVLVFKRSS